MSSIRNRTRKRNLGEITVTREWVLAGILRGRCEVTNIEFELGPGTGEAKSNPWAPSVDRIDSTLGYTQENCQLVVWMYNAAKGEWKDSSFNQLAWCYLEQKGYTIQEPQ